MNPAILTMGLNHASAPIQIRERVALARCTQADSLARLAADLDSSSLNEVLVLSTCNRTEVYATARDLAEAELALGQMFGRDESFGGSRHVYWYSHREAVAHLFAVSSGIDSMILGESEILGQVRTAYEQGAEAGTVGPILHRLFKDAIHVGKRAHSETSIGSGPRSVAYAAVALARKQIGSLIGKNILVIGAGEMARRAAQDLAGDGASMVMISNRTLDRGAQLAEEIRGSYVGFERLPQSLERADVVICATGAPHILLDAEMIRTAAESRSVSLLLIDISVPRNIAPDAGTIPNVCLKNIDDLMSLTDSTQAIRERAVDEVKAIIVEETELFWRWFMERRAAPTICELRNRAEEIRSAELDKALRRLGHLHLTQRDRNVITALSAGIINKLLASPTAHLKERAQRGDGDAYLTTLRDLFDLDGNEQTDISATL